MSTSSSTLSHPTVVPLTASKGYGTLLSKDGETCLSKRVSVRSKTARKPLKCYTRASIVSILRLLSGYSTLTIEL